MAKWQRRHYETIAVGLKAKGSPRAEIDEWARKFAADNPRFRADYFIAAATGGEIQIQTRQRGGRTITRAYRNRSRPRRPFKVPSLAGLRWLQTALRKNTKAKGYRYKVVCPSSTRTMVTKSIHKKKSAATKAVQRLSRKGWWTGCRVRKIGR
jgi:hypothetical protein